MLEKDINLDIIFVLKCIIYDLYASLVGYILSKILPTFNFNDHFLIVFNTVLARAHPG